MGFSFRQLNVLGERANDLPTAFGKVLLMRDRASLHAPTPGGPRGRHARDLIEELGLFVGQEGAEQFGEFGRCKIVHLNYAVNAHWVGSP